MHVSRIFKNKTVLLFVVFIKETSENISSNGDKFYY
jgi:hypothetical protein